MHDSNALQWESDRADKPAEQQRGETAHGCTLSVGMHQYTSNLYKSAVMEVGSGRVTANSSPNTEGVKAAWGEGTSKGRMGDNPTRVTSKHIWDDWKRDSHAANHL